MPLDAAGFAYVLTESEKLELWMLKRARRRIRYRWMWMQYGCDTNILRQLFGRCVTEALERKLRSSVGFACARRLFDHLPVGHRLNEPYCFVTQVRAYNDWMSTTHADVLALLDRAIGELEPAK